MLKVHKIAELYNLKLYGDLTDAEINNVNSLDNQKNDGLSWIKNQKSLEKVKKGFFIVGDNLSITNKKNVVYLITNQSAKIIFSKIITELFSPRIDFYLKNCISEHLKNENIKISENVFIGKNVSIGDGTIIYPNVVIEANTVIGDNCIIKSHVSLGTEGLGLELDKTINQLVKFPQLGNVVLENNIDIGPNSTVRRATLDSTIIKSGSKIGSFVNIGHNSEIGKNCILTCNIVTGGSSKIGNNTFIGVNSVIKNGLNIGSNSIIGMGSVVTKELKSNIVAYGNPAKEIRKNT